MRVIIISDSLGDSAAAIAEAAASQFTMDDVVMERLPNASNIELIEQYLNSMIAQYEASNLVVFFTITNPDLSIQTKGLLRRFSVAYVDVLGPALNTMASVSGQMPLSQPGLTHKTSAEYYQRVEAMEFAVNHDDGRNSQELVEADIVLIGSSRTSKTPLAIYLATLGYKVANVPLVPGSEPPRELFWVERSRLFGLMSQPALLASIRHRRLGNAADVAGNYASIDYVQDDLDESRALMRRLGCIVVRTDNRAIEEIAAEVLRYYHDGESSARQEISPNG